MSDEAWDAYAAAATTQVGAAMRQLLSEAGARARLTTREDTDTTCDFCVVPENEAAAGFRVVLGTIDGRIRMGNCVYRFEWLDIATARQIIEDAFSAVIAGNLTEWGPSWHARGRIELLDGREVEFGACSLTVRPWRGSARRYEPYTH